MRRAQVDAEPTAEERRQEEERRARQEARDLRFKVGVEICLERWSVFEPRTQTPTLNRNPRLRTRTLKPNPTLSRSDGRSSNPGPDLQRSEPVIGLCEPALDAGAAPEPQDPGALHAEAYVFISKASNEKTPTYSKAIAELFTMELDIGFNIDRQARNPMLIDILFSGTKLQSDANRFNFGQNSFCAWQRCADLYLSVIFTGRKS